MDAAGVKYDARGYRVPFRPTEAPLVGKRKKRGKKKMNKRYLPIIASIFILALTASSLLPAYAALPRMARAMPTLNVVTIAEDDETRNTGIILLADTVANFKAQPTTGWPQDLLAQFKVLVSYNGVPVAPTSFYCQVIEKDKYNVLKFKQGTWENLGTWSKDASSNFECKLRWGKPGVGVIDVYFVGTAAPQMIADYVLVVSFDKTVGRSLVYGTEIQDICVLGWNEGDVAGQRVTKPDGNYHYVFQDSLGDFVSCEDAAMYQKHYVMNLPIPWV